MRDGTSAGGLPMTSYCNNWTNAKTDVGFIGSASAKTGEWSYITPAVSCSVPEHLYCVEQ